MHTFHRKLLLKAFKVFDVFVMICSFAMALLAVYYRFGTISLSDFLSMRFTVQNFLLFLALLWVWHQIFAFNGLYHSRRLSSGKTEIIDVIKATSLGTAILFVAAIVFKIEIITSVFLFVFWALDTATTLVSRLILRWVLSRVRIRGRNLRQLLIVGANERAIKFAENVAMKPELGYRIIGFVDREWAGTEDLRKTDYDLVANLDVLPDYLRNHVVDEVLIALPLKSYYQQASHIVALCEEQGIIVRYVSDLFNPKGAYSRAEQFESALMISHYIGAMNGRSMLLKRILDLSLSLIGLIILLPLLLVTALTVRITSPGPILFRQERVGLNKRIFRLYKFRTMIADAETKMAELEHLNEVSGPVFKIKDDPRITPIGMILRKTSIDEMPQLFNVLKGDMSLVGPRPLPLRDYQGFNQDWHRRRFSVRPGITGLWQVNGRSNISFEQWMKFDIQYIDHWTLWLDLKILFRTIPAVLKASGAS